MTESCENHRPTVEEAMFHIVPIKKKIKESFKHIKNLFGIADNMEEVIFYFCKS